MSTTGKNLTDSYNSISTLSTGTYKESGSKFLSFAYPVTSENEIKNILTAIKKEYFDATHHCYAYRLGISGEPWRANDDGEPSSTAGRPIFGQLLSYGLSDILVVVVRYFGGTKLGVPGLIRAYKSATQSALDGAEVIQKLIKLQYIVKFGYQDLNSVMRIFKEFSIIPEDQHFEMNCSITANIRMRDVDTFIKRLKETIINIDICQKA